jgi:hypothetical protein
MNAVSLATKGIICGGNSGTSPSVPQNVTYGRPPMEIPEQKISISVNKMDVEDNIQIKNTVGIGIKVNKINIEIN